MMDLVSSFLALDNHLAHAVRNYFFAFVGSTQELCPLSIFGSQKNRTDCVTDHTGLGFVKSNFCRKVDSLDVPYSCEQ